MKDVFFIKKFGILNVKYYLANVKYYISNYLFYLYCKVYYHLKDPALIKKKPVNKNELSDIYHSSLRNNIKTI